MKIDLSIDATPEEMREFLGLPNIKPLQDEMMQAIQDNMQQGATGFDPVSLMKPLFPAQMQSLDMLQKTFMDAFNKSNEDAAKKKPAGAGKK